MGASELDQDLTHRLILELAVLVTISEYRDLYDVILMSHLLYCVFFTIGALLLEQNGE